MIIFGLSSVKKSSPTLYWREVRKVLKKNFFVAVAVVVLMVVVKVVVKARKNEILFV